MGTKLLKTHVLEDVVRRGTFSCRKSPDCSEADDKTHRYHAVDSKFRLRRKIIEAATKAEILAPFTDIQQDLDNQFMRYDNPVVPPPAPLTSPPPHVGG